MVEENFVINSLSITDAMDDIRRLVATDRKLSVLVSQVDHRLIFSVSRIPHENPPTGWLPEGFNTFQMAAYFSESWKDYRIVLFKFLDPVSLTNKGQPEKLTVEVHEIAELHDYDGKPIIVRLLQLDQDDPLLIRYSFATATVDNAGTVELDLQRLVGDFPRLVERIADMINFLGEVVVAGFENQ